MRIASQNCVLHAFVVDRPQASGMKGTHTNKKEPSFQSAAHRSKELCDKQGPKSGQRHTAPTSIKQTESHRITKGFLSFRVFLGATKQNNSIIKLDHQTREDTC